MSALATSHTVNDHQSLLGNGGVHTRRFTHNGHVNLGQMGQGQRESVSTAHLLFARCQIHQVVIGFASQYPIYLQKRNQSASAVVGAQSIQTVALDSGREWVTRPRCHRLHRVDVCIEQQRRFLWVNVLLNENIVPNAFIGQAPLPDEIGKNVRSGSLFTAYRRCLDELHQQLHRIIRILLYLHNWCKVTKFFTFHFSLFTFFRTFAPN